MLVLLLVMTSIVMTGCDGLSEIATDRSALDTFPDYEVYKLKKYTYLIVDKYGNIYYARAGGTFSSEITEIKPVEKVLNWTNPSNNNN